MTRFNSANFGFLTIGQYDISPVTQKLEDNISKPAIETTPYGVTAPEYAAGILKRYEITGQEGFYDDATTTANADLVAMASTEKVMIFAPWGNTDPATGVGVGAIATDGVLYTNYKRIPAVGDYHRGNLEIAVSGAVDQNCKLVHPLSAEGVTGTSAALYLNWGADGAAGGRVYLAVTSITWGTRTSLVIALQDCNTSDGSYSDHTTFTTISSPATGASEMKALANATIEQYTCVTWTWAGGDAGSEAVTFAVAVVYD